MNIKSDIMDFMCDEIIVSKKNLYCSNCNKKGHIYKKCKEPIISNGIIGIYIDDFDMLLIPKLEKFISQNLHKNIKFNFTTINPNIQFCMVQRRFSLGYMEFIRGRYDVNNIDEIKFLLEQMTPDEISNIKKYDFDYLWNIVWIDDSNIDVIYKNKYHYNEYIISKQKFYNLRTEKFFIFNDVDIKYNFNEWGFPKGRRNTYETDIVCAMREFEEETNINEKQYIVLDDNNCIIENLIGTNGKKYRHNYFIALVSNIDIIKTFNKEIADVSLMNFNKCITNIRPYHIDKIKIITKIHNLIQQFLFSVNT